MDDDSDFSDGEIVWVKLSYCWWPGEVLAGDRLTEEFLASLKRRPLAVVKFFDEDTYEYVKNTNFIYKYNCSRKNEFLRKGLEQYRAKNKHMIKFPADVMQAERATGGDPNIVNSSDFLLPQKRESYADIFSPNKSKGKAAAAAAITPRSSGKKSSPASPSKSISVIPVRKHEVRILMQASSPTGMGVSRLGALGGSSLTASPVTPRMTSNNSSLNSSLDQHLVASPGAGGVTSSPAQIYHCHKCGFESGRQNVIVLHTKHCRAVPLVPFNIPSVREPKPVQPPPAKPVEMPKLTPVTPKPATPKPSAAEQAKKVPEPEEELVEVIQVLDTTPVTPARGGRTPRAATVVASATSASKVDRRKKRGRNDKAAVEEVVAPVVADADEEMEVLMEVTDPAPAPTEADSSVKEEDGKSLDDSTGNNSSKGKADVEFKNELLADWSEDEQDDQEPKEDKSTIKPEPVEDEVDKAVVTEKAAPVVSISDTSAEKSVESSPQLASPVSSGTTIKYRNIPKKQKREFIEVTNDQPVLPTNSSTAASIEKSSSESSISTAATCGETLSLPDKTATTSNESVPERPISAKQRILDRATRGSSSKSNSSDDQKQESPTTTAAKVTTAESQPVPVEEPKKEISCFDFKEEEEEEVVLNKSPRRSLSNKRDVSMDTTAETVKQEQEEQERAKKDAELKNEIDTLLGESTLPALPELPKMARAASPQPSSSTETTPQQPSKEEIDRNRTLPPKERGKRIFKTRNKIIENEAIALEQSKAIVMDFVKKSHEEELAELRQQQEAEKKLSSESPTTTNDDSQESVASTEPVKATTGATRFEKSEFAAIKAKRTKLPQPAEDVVAPKVEPVVESSMQKKEPKDQPEESAVSSTNESKPAETPETLPVSISKDQIALDSLEKATESSPSAKTKGKKVKSPAIVSPIVLIERLAPEMVETEHFEEATPKSRKKRSSEMDKLAPAMVETEHLEEATSKSRKKRSSEMEKLVPEKVEAEHLEDTTPKSRKKRSSEMDKLTPEKIETEQLEEATSKSRKKRSSEMDKLAPAMVETEHLEEVTSKSRKKRTSEMDKLAPEKVETEHIEGATSKSRKKRSSEMDKLAPEKVEAEHFEDATPKSRKKQPSEMDKLAPEKVEAEHIEDATPKSRKKQSSEMDKIAPEKLETEPLEDATPKSRKKQSSEMDKPAPEKLEMEPLDDTTSKSRKKRASEMDKLTTEKVETEPLEEATSKSKKKRSSEMDKLAPEKAETEHLENTTPKSRKKRSSEMDNLDLTALDIPRGRRGRSVKPEEPVVVAEARVEPAKESDDLVTPVVHEKKSRNKRAKKEEEKVDVEEQPKELEASEQIPTTEITQTPKTSKHTPAAVEIAQTPKSSKSKRGKTAAQQRSADSTADLRPSGPEPATPEPVAPAEVASEVKEIDPIPEPAPAPIVVKHQPIKMIIKSKGRKSNSELICEPVIVSPVEPKVEENREKLPKSPKSSKRKKTPVEDLPEPTPEDGRPPMPVETTPKSHKSKRPKFRNEPPKTVPELPAIVSEPTATDLQIAEALINLPEATVPKPATVEQDSVETKPNTSSSVPSVSTPKSINPRKRHLQTLMSSVAEPAPQPKPSENVTIPEKRKRETIEVVSVAPATIVLDKPSVAQPSNTGAQPIDDDKFDIDNIPIVMDDSELLGESAISTTTTSGSSSRKLVVPANSASTAADEDEEVKLISTTKPMTKKIVIVKSSNGSAKIVSPKETTREIPVPIPKKSLGIKSTTITIKPPVDQLSPSAARSPAHSPPIRSAQLVQASSGGQIVITSKGTVLTTQSPATSSSKTQLAAGAKTHLTHSSSSKASVVVTSACTISSSTSLLDSPTSSMSNLQRGTTTTSANAGSSAIKSPAKICVQSQEIIHPPTKPRSVTPKTQQSPVVQSAEVSQKKLHAGSSSSVKKGLVKKHAEASTSSSDKPLFSTSKGAPITSAESPGMVEDKGKGKVLTASGLKKFRQEQQQLQQQQKQQPRSEKPPRAHSVDEEPSTSTPTPPPPSEAPAEVVVAAAADSSVKELPVTPVDAEQSPETTPEAADKQQPQEAAVSEENEADAAEPEAESSTSDAVTTADELVPPSEVVEPTESAPLPAEIPVEAAETSSNVQESSQLIAVPAENFGGPANLFYLCSVREEGFVPVNNELLYLDASNQLVALPEQASVEDIVNQAEVLEIPAGSDQAALVAAHAAVGDVEGAVEAGQQNILLNTQDGQQIILDQQSLMALAAGGDTSQLLTPDGQQILLQGSAQELLAALAVSQPGLGIVAAEGTQIIVAPESLIDLQDAPLPGEIIQVNPSTTVETNAILTKPPIMSTVEVPTKNGNGSADASAHSPEQKLLEPASTNLDESLAAVIGVPGNPNVPTSLELPITVTNPIIAKTTTSKINPIYQPAAIGIDPAAAAAAVIDLPTVAQTGTDIHVDNNSTHESSSSDGLKAAAEAFEPSRAGGDDGEDEGSKRSPDANGKCGAADRDDDENREDDPDFDEIIPTTPESQMNSHAEISSQFSDDELDASSVAPIPDEEGEDDDDDDDNASNFSEVIPIQPNVVILRNVNNELINNNENENSSDMELDHPTNPAPGNEENTPNQAPPAGHESEAMAFESAANSAMVER